MHCLAFKLYGPPDYAAYSEAPAIRFVPEFESMGLVDKDWSEKIDCLASSTAPLFGQGVARDKIGVLSDTWMGHDAGTPVISGQKVGAEQFAVVTNAFVDLDSQTPTLVEKEAAAQVQAPRLMAEGLSLENFIALPLRLASGYAAGNGAYLGAAGALNHAFPVPCPGKGANLQQGICDPLHSVWIPEAADLSRMQTDLNAIGQFLWSKYLRDNTDKVCDDLLAEADRKMQALLGKDYCSPFPFYLLAAAAHMLILQERALLLLPPADHKDRVAALSKFINTYEKNVQQAMVKFNFHRLSYIKEPTRHTRESALDIITKGTASFYWDFRDDFPGRDPGWPGDFGPWFVFKGSDAEKHAKDEYLQHHHEVELQMLDAMQGDKVVQIITKWKEWKPDW